MSRLLKFLVVISALLAGCSSPSFDSPPPDAYLVPLPGEINGVWANEAENGERVRLSGQKDGTLLLYFSNTNSIHDHAPAEPLLAQTLRFDNTNWLLLDFNKLAAWQGEQSAEKSPYRLLKYVLENPDRLCGIEMSTSVFAEGIAAGQLAGSTDATYQELPESKKIISAVVTSPGADWVKWWSALPEAKKIFGAAWCFHRVK